MVVTTCTHATIPLKNPSMPTSSPPPPPPLPQKVAVSFLQIRHNLISCGISFKVIRPLPLQSGGLLILFLMMRRFAPCREGFQLNAHIDIFKNIFSKRVSKIRNMKA
jgi:hypothetical protein